MPKKVRGQVRKSGDEGWFLIFLAIPLLGILILSLDYNQPKVTAEKPALSDSQLKVTGKGNDPPKGAGKTLQGTQGLQDSGVSGKLYQNPAGSANQLQPGEDEKTFRNVEGGN
jgi:hypothetical protein